MRALQDGSIGAKSENEADTSQQTDASTSTAPAETRRGLPKVRSGLNIANIYTEVKDGPIQQKE